MINDFAPVIGAGLFKGLLFKWIEGPSMQDILIHTNIQMLLLILWNKWLAFSSIVDPIEEEGHHILIESPAQKLSPSIGPFN